QIKLLYQIEKLHSIFESQQTAIMEIWRRLFYSSQRKGLERTLRGHHHAAFHPWYKEPFDCQIVHQIVRVERWYMTCIAIGFAEEEVLTSCFTLGRFRTVKLSIDV